MDPRRNPYSHYLIGQIPHHHRARPYHAARSDMYARQHTRTNPQVRKCAQAGPATHRCIRGHVCVLANFHVVFHHCARIHNHAVAHRRIRIHGRIRHHHTSSPHASRPRHRRPRMHHRQYFRAPIRAALCNPVPRRIVANSQRNRDSRASSFPLQPLPAAQHCESHHFRAPQLFAVVHKSRKFVFASRHQQVRQHRPQRPHQDPSIQRQTPILHVPHIQHESLLPTRRVSPVHLRPPGDSRLHFVPTHLLRAVAFQVLHQQRPWPHQTHIASQHIPQLRQLIQTQPPQHLPQRRHTRLIRQQPSLSISRLPHRAKLQQRERPSAQPRSPLPKNHWRSIAHPNRQPHRQHHRPHHQKRHRRHRHVHPPFHHQLHRMSFVWARLQPCRHSRRSQLGSVDRGLQSGRDSAAEVCLPARHSSTLSGPC